MSDVSKTKDLIAEARRSSDSLRNAPFKIDRETFADGIDALADALEAATRERDAVVAAKAYEQGCIDQKRSTELYGRYQRGEISEVEFGRLMETAHRRAAEYRKAVQDG